jgi:hypothetical protein
VSRRVLITIAILVVIIATGLVMTVKKAVKMPVDIAEPAKPAPAAPR